MSWAYVHMHLFIDCPFSGSYYLVARFPCVAKDFDKRPPPPGLSYGLTPSTLLPFFPTPSLCSNNGLHKKEIHACLQGMIILASGFSEHRYAFDSLNILLWI